MRNLSIGFPLLLVLGLSACKQVNETKIQLSSKSKKHQHKFTEFVNHDEGVHFVKLDTMTNELIIKHDFEEYSIKNIEEFILNEKIDSTVVAEEKKDSIPVVEPKTEVEVVEKNEEEIEQPEIEEVEDEPVIIEDQPTENSL